MTIIPNKDIVNLSTTAIPVQIASQDKRTNTRTIILYACHAMRYIGSLQHYSTLNLAYLLRVSSENLKKPHQKFSLWRLNSSYRHGNGLFHGKIGGASAGDITPTLLGAREAAPHIFRFISPTLFFWRRGGGFESSCHLHFYLFGLVSAFCSDCAHT